MAKQKGSIRKKGSKWYYRFYIKNEFGKRVQKECKGSTSKTETQAMLRHAIREYEKFGASSLSPLTTLEKMMDIWVSEYVIPGHLSNGTLKSYMNTVNQIKKHPIAKVRFKQLTVENLQSYIDSLTTKTTLKGGEKRQALSVTSTHIYMTVLRAVFKYALFPKRLITFNPMEYVVERKERYGYDLFSVDSENGNMPLITHERFSSLVEYLSERASTALLPVQIAYYTGLRLGEIIGLCWTDIDLENQTLTVRRSISYNSNRKKIEIGATKSKKIRVVPFGNDMTQIFKSAKHTQENRRKLMKKDYFQNYYCEVKEASRIYYDLYSLELCEHKKAGCKKINLVCIDDSGKFVSASSVSYKIKHAGKKALQMENLYFHLFRHIYTSNLLSCGASAKEVKELLGHSSIQTTLDIYAHSSIEDKKKTAKLLDKQDSKN